MPIDIRHLFEIDLPVIQAPMAGSQGSALAIAVSNAGGLGSLPCAIIGAEEANPMLYRIEYMTKSLGIPYIPITPTFPALGPLGLLPAPTKWKVRFGEPISFDGYGPEAADDEILVGHLAERVRSTIQGLVDQALGARRSIWFG